MVSSSRTANGFGIFHGLSNRTYLGTFSVTGLCSVNSPSPSDVTTKILSITSVSEISDSAWGRGDDSLSLSFATAVSVSSLISASFLSFLGGFESSL